MSQLTNLKGTIERVAQGASTTGRNLTSFDRTFAIHAAEVHNAIGGSTQRKDQEVIATIENARRRVREATEALEVAARVAQNYGRSL